MNLPNLLTESDYAIMRGVSIRTIQRERALRTGAPFIKLGKSVFYRKAAIEAWVMSHEQSHRPARKSV
jgi:hypothetical protein